MEHPVDICLAPAQLGQRRVPIGRSRGLLPVADARLERFVRAMLRPGLRQRFELAIGRLTVKASEVVPNRVHLVEVERENSLAAERFKRRVVQVAHRHPLNCGRRRRGQREQAAVEVERLRRFVRPQHHHGFD